MGKPYHYRHGHKKHTPFFRESDSVNKQLHSFVVDNFVVSKLQITLKHNKCFGSRDIASMLVVYLFLEESV